MAHEQKTQKNLWLDTSYYPDEKSHVHPQNDVHTSEDILCKNEKKNYFDP